MHAWEQIQQSIDYIEAHLAEDISIDALAKQAALSPFYYQRLFARLVGKPVAEYVKLRRLAKATELLRDRDKRILDVALELGFSSHEQLTRGFRETFGITPDAYRKQPVALNRMTKPELLLRYALVDENVPLVTEGIVMEVRRQRLESPARYLGLKRDAPLSFLQGLGTESGVDPLDAVWNDFHALKLADPSPFASDEELGVVLASQTEGCFAYFGGGRVGEATQSSTLDAFELPVGEYVVCFLEAERFEALVMDALYKAEQYLFNIWLPAHKLQTEPFCAEIYPRHSADTTSMQVWLKIAEG